MRVIKHCLCTEEHSLKNALDNEVHNLVLEHSVRMVVRDEERDVVTLSRCTFEHLLLLSCRNMIAHLDRFPSQDDEALRSLHHEARELVAQYPLDFIRLLDLDAYPHRVH